MAKLNTPTERTPLVADSKIGGNGADSVIVHGGALHTRLIEFSPPVFIARNSP